MAEVASAFVSIMPSAKGFGKQLDSQIGGDVEGSGKKAGSRWGSALKTGALAGLAGLGVVASKLLGDSVTAASEAQQAVGGVEAVFGKYADGVLRDSKKAAQGLGLSAAAYNELITVSGAMLKNKGLETYAADAKNLVTVGADLSAMFGGTTTQAVEALNSALRGESDPIEKYGISLNAAAIEAEAVSSGLVKNVKNFGAIKAAQNTAILAQRKYNDALKENGKGSNEALAAESSLIRAKAALTKALDGEKIKLTDSQKAQAALTLVQKQSADATGAFARESNTLAGQQQRLGAQFDNLKVTVGTQLLPALTSVASFVNTTALPAFAQFGAKVSAVAGFVSRNRVAFTALATAIAAVVVVTKIHTAVMAVQAAGGLLAVLKATKIVTAATKAYAAIQWLLNAALTANPIGIVIVALAALGAGLVIAYKKSETFRNIVNNAFEAVKSGAQSVANFVTKTIPAAFSTAVEFVRGIPAKIAAIFTGAASIFYNAGVQLMAQLAAGITAKIGDAVAAAQAGLSRLKGLLPGSPIKWGPLKNWNNGGAGKRLMELVAKGITAATPKTVKAAQSAFEKIQSSLETTRDNLRSTLDGLKGDFASIADSVSGAFTGNLFEATTAGDFIANLTAKKGELQGLLASFATLKGWGVPGAFLSQLFASGNGALITELAGMGQAGAVSTANLFGEVTSLGDQLGNSVASNDPVAARIEETNKELRQVNRQLEFLAGDIGKELNEAASRAQRNRKNRGKK